MKLRTRPEAILSALLVGSACLNLALAARLHSERGRRLAARSLQQGDKVPSLLARTPGGQPVVLSYGIETRPRVFYVFRPGCGWCDANRPNILALANGAKQQFEFVGLCLQGRPQEAQECVTSHPVPFPVYVDISAKTRSEYKLSGTPQTLVVTSDGTVVRNWRGAYLDDQVREIESFFNVSLPGLDSPPHKIR